MLEQIKCVIFDCEGTLIDSETLCCQALVSVFTSYGAKLTVEECLTNFTGGKLADILSSTRDRLGLQVSIDELEPLYREKLRILFQAHLTPMPGADDLLQYLKDNNIEICVVTNGPKNKLHFSLEITGLSEFFKDRMFSAFEANSWKPDPDLILYASMHMGFRPEECVYIDDTPKGVAAGVAANIKTYHFRSNTLGPHVDDTDVTPVESLVEFQSYLTN